jgi:aspartate oxidase
MEMVQFHPTGMVWPEKALGALATEAIRYNGDALKINKNIQTSNLLSIRNW